MLLNFAMNSHTGKTESVQRPVKLFVIAIPQDVMHRTVKHRMVFFTKSTYVLSVILVVNLKDSSLEITELCVYNAAKVPHGDAVKLIVMHWMELNIKMADAKHAGKVDQSTAMKLIVISKDGTSKMANVGNATKITHSFAMKLIVISKDGTSKMANVRNAAKVTNRDALKLIVLHWVEPSPMNMNTVIHAAKIVHGIALKLINVMHSMDIASTMATVHDATNITHGLAMKLNVMY